MQDDSAETVVRELKARILEQEQINHRLASSHARLRAILDNEPECVKLLAADGSVLDINPAGLRMVEADSLEQVRNLCVYTLIVEEHRAAFRALNEKVLRGGSGVLEFEIEGLKHGRRWLETHASPLRDDSGTVIAALGITRDITERRRAERLEAGQREILASIVAQRPLREILGDIALLQEALDPGSVCSLQLLEADGRHILHGAAPNLPEEFNQAVHGLEIGDHKGSCGTAAYRRERVIVADIATHPYWQDYRHLALAHGLRACWSTPVFGRSGEVLGTFAVYYREVREPGRAEVESVDKLLPTTAIAIESASLIERLRERDCFFDLSTDIYCIFDPAKGRIVQVNPTFCRVTGFTAEELASRHYLEFIHPEDRPASTDAIDDLRLPGGRVQKFAYRFLCKDDSYRWLEWESVSAPDGLAYSVARDITEQRRAETELDYAATHDAITSLPHHLVLERLLIEMLEDASGSVWVLFVGLDRFQTINESMGHVIGDEVLRGMADRLRLALGDAGHIARFAGDEFVIVSAQLDRPSALSLAGRLREAVAQPIESDNFRLLLTASIGISHSPQHGNSPQDLLRRAEAAMTKAKREGRDSVCEFSVEQMLETEDRLVLGVHLRAAVRRGEFELHYQPHYDAAERTLTGFEALLRWRSGELGPVSPGRFIPIAEALGLMPEIGEWVVNESCRQARDWLDRGHVGFTISVNVSAQQLQRSGLVAQVGAALRRHSLPPEVLSIELTESSLMENVVRVRGTLTELKSMGVTLSLDDFGTGYSSLAYLKQFPIDKLKIDQSFVRGLPDDADDNAIARTIVAMAHQMRMVVAAEGVETEPQAAFLESIGCDELQGYLLGRPVAAEEAEAFFPAVAA